MKQSVYVNGRQAKGIEAAVFESQASLVGCATEYLESLRHYIHPANMVVARIEAFDGCE